MLGTLSERLRRWLVRLARFRPGPELRVRLLVASLVVFLAATGVAVVNLPPVTLQVPWLAPLVLLVLLTVALNALEFHLVGRVSGIRVDGRRALEITVWSRAANLLPLPGAAAVRAHDLASTGGGWSTPARALVSTALASLSVSFAAAAVAVATTGPTAVAAAFSGCAVLVTLLMILVLPTRSGDTGRWTAGLLVLRAGFVLVGGLRFYVVARALGLRVPLIVAFAFSLSSSVASAAGIFPDGLGVRELVAGGLAPLVGVEPSVGVSVTALDRVASFVLVALVAGGLSLGSPVRDDE